jgi:hypothetical protein
MQSVLTLTRGRARRWGTRPNCASPQTIYHSPSKYSHFLKTANFSMDVRTNLLSAFVLFLLPTLGNDNFFYISNTYKLQDLTQGVPCSEPTASPPQAWLSQSPASILLNSKRCQIKMRPGRASLGRGPQRFVLNIWKTFEGRIYNAQG